MLFGDHMVVIRGGGDLASGAAYQLHRAGFPVVILELAMPLAIRRAVSFASAVTEGEVSIEGISGVRAGSVTDAVSVAQGGAVAVLVSPDPPDAVFDVVVDARIAKRNIDTHIDQAKLVIGLGPGFTAGVDCHIVIETQRGHHLGRVLREGQAEPDSGVPPTDGLVTWRLEIGETVKTGVAIGSVADQDVVATIDGVVRGLLTPGFNAQKGLKIADIDPRGEFGLFRDFRGTPSWSGRTRGNFGVAEPARKVSLAEPRIGPARTRLGGRSGWKVNLVASACGHRRFTVRLLRHRCSDQGTDRPKGKGPGP